MTSAPAPSRAYLDALDERTRRLSATFAPLTSPHAGAPASAIAAVRAALEAHGPDLLALAATVHDLAEEAFAETGSAAAVADLLRRHGHEVEVGVGGLPTALQQLSKHGVWVVGLDGGGSTGLWDLPAADGPIVLVLGAEGAGLSRLVRQRCDEIASIPLAGSLGSLNVAAAAALACFEVAHARAR